MSKINIKFMSDYAMATLRSNIDFVSKKLIENPSDNSWFYSWIGKDPFVVKKYEIEDLNFKIPKDSKDRQTDIENSIMLYEHLHSLPGYILSDERFWAWINFEKAYAVALKYMPVESGKAVFKDHWLFTQGKRRGLFFGVISRCYYRVALTVTDSGDDPYEFSRFVIENPLRFRNLTWRAYSNEKFIIAGAMKAAKRVLDENHGYENNDNYTELAKQISLLASVKLLDAMTEKDIEDFAYEKLSMMVSQQKKDSGIVERVRDAVMNAFSI